ncbi:MAG: hypothetical protein JSR44_04845 [Spirochaetes bacterium]|nr:hypothetical protein [Spirochaetota bacterium]
MRRYHSFVMLVAASTTSLFAAPKSYANLMKQIAREATAKICANMTTAPACVFKFDAVTENPIDAEQTVVAFSWTVRWEQKRLNRTEQATLVATLFNSGYQVLNTDEAQVSAATYFRREKAEIKSITREAFMRLTLNPKNQSVARLNADFLARGNTLAYSLPQEWEHDGMKAGTTREFSLTLFAQNDIHFSLSAVDLDDKPLEKLTIRDCVDGTTPAPNPLKLFVVKLRERTFRCKLTAGRNFKAKQPAFKLKLTEEQQVEPFLQLAIMVKPQPNYFLFGVSGFLVGGLIAVMTLMMKRRKAAEVS